jgi:hypothetical protein
VSQIKTLNPMDKDFTHNLIQTLRLLDDRIAALEPKTSSAPGKWTPDAPKGSIKVATPPGVIVNPAGRNLAQPKGSWKPDPPKRY